MLRAIARTYNNLPKPAVLLMGINVELKNAPLCVAKDVAKRVPMGPVLLAKRYANQIAANPAFAVRTVASDAALKDVGRGSVKPRSLVIHT